MDEEQVREGLGLGLLRRTASGSIELTERGVEVLGDAATRRWGRPGETYRLTGEGRARLEDDVNGGARGPTPPRKRARWFARRR